MKIFVTALTAFVCYFDLQIAASKERAKVF